jgi:hypothetical protein
MQESLLQEGLSHSVGYGRKVLRHAFFYLLIGLGFVMFLCSVPGIRQQLSAQEPAITMAWSNMQPARAWQVTQPARFPMVQPAKVPQMLPTRVGHSVQPSGTQQFMTPSVAVKATKSTDAGPAQQQSLDGSPWATSDGSKSSQSTVDPFLRVDTTGLQSGLGPSNTTGSSYVFVQRFPMARSRLVPRWIRQLFPFYHTDILLSPRSSFSVDDQQYLDAQISGMTNFAKIEDSWWQTKTTSAAQIGYGYGECSARCCNVKKVEMPLNNRSSVVAGLDLSQKSIFVYGTTEKNADGALHALCNPENTRDDIWSNWDHEDFHIYKNNCNTFTSTMLQNIFGLSQEHPLVAFEDEVGFFDVTEVMTPASLKLVRNWLTAERPPITETIRTDLNLAAERLNLK